VRELVTFKVLNSHLKSLFPSNVVSGITQRFQKMLFLQACQGKFDFLNNSIVTAIMAGVVNNFLFKLKKKAHIPLPNALNLIGVVDETGILEEG